MLVLRRFHFILSLLVGLFLTTQDSAVYSQNNPPIYEQGHFASAAFDLPMHIAPNLSGGFAELRTNHLHSGIDFKTAQQTGVPVFAPADGWVSRIRISAFGFGYALYLDHPGGYTTVYGHLKAYAEPVASEAIAMQYKCENFELDTLLTKNRIPVRKGQLIAFSGNSGISVAPHLHFEIRDTKTEETIDPLLWYSDRIKDKTPPRATRIALFAVENTGVLAGNRNKAWTSVVKTGNGEWHASAPLPAAWGQIGLGISANDFMDGNSNPYGVCSIRLFQDEQLIFQQELSRFGFDETRAVNALVDYETCLKQGLWIMKSFVDPGNHLQVFPVLKNQGIVTLNEKREYHFRYELTDRSGNTTAVHFSVKAEPMTVSVQKQTGKKMVFWVPNYFYSKDFKLEIPVGALYKTLGFLFDQVAVPNGYSGIYRVHDRFTPLHIPVRAAFRVSNDCLEKKTQYYLVRLNNNKVVSAVESRYEDGWLLANLAYLGDYRILADSVPPKITLQGLESITKNGVIRIRISDAASGIRKWRGTVDGKWVLFSLDGKSGLLTCELKTAGVSRSQTHHLILSAEDACGNSKQIETTFLW